MRGTSLRKTGGRWSRGSAVKKAPASAAPAPRPRSTSSNCSAASLPISRLGWRTVVSAGHSWRRQRDVVEAADRKVLRHLQAVLAGRPHHAGSHVVVGREHRRGPLLPGKQLRARPSTPEPNVKAPCTTSAGSSASPPRPSPRDSRPAASGWHRGRQCPRTCAMRRWPSASRCSTIARAACCSSIVTPMLVVAASGDTLAYGTLRSRRRFSSGA